MGIYIYIYIYLLKIGSLLNCLCTSKELRPAPAALFFGVVCPGDPVQQGVALLVLLCPF